MEHEDREGWMWIAAAITAALWLSCVVVIYFVLLDGEEHRGLFEGALAGGAGAAIGLLLLLFSVDGRRNLADMIGRLRGVKPSPRRQKEWRELFSGKEPSLQGLAAAWRFTVPVWAALGVLMVLIIVVLTVVAVVEKLAA